MSRIPPCLLYLTIYNPTLRPTGPTPGGDDKDDAEEQAHILFYTSRERAVSRDRMLRQVGLAKALVNFADMFNADDPCDNVHSQSRRMLMVSPEPDFWIHAGIELARIPRPAADKLKGKGKSKGKDKDKDKGKEKEKETPPVYDFQDASVNDLALRYDLMRAYERFKLLHGSFTTILSTLGQQALELQLERFFTVWAWSWDIEGGYEFGPHLGTPLHPLHHLLNPVLDHHTSQMLHSISTVVISPSHAVPSTRFVNARFPSALPAHLFSLIIPPREPPPSDTATSVAPTTDVAEGTIKGNSPSVPIPVVVDAPNPPSPGPGSPGGQSTFLGVPAMNLNMHMDVRKWNWPGYLTFSKGSGKRLPSDEDKDLSEKAEPEPEEETSTVAEVDQSALEDAISSDNVHTSPPTPAVEPQTDQGLLPDSAHSLPVLDIHTPGTLAVAKVLEHPVVVRQTGDIEEAQVEPLVENTHTDVHAERPAEDPHAEARPDPIVDGTHTDAHVEAGASSQGLDTTGTTAQVPPPPEFAFTRIHLANTEDVLATRPQKVLYILKYPLLVALVGVKDDIESSQRQSLAECATRILDSVENVIDEDALKSATETLPSATKILQPKDRHIITADKYTTSSPGFESNSEHLYYAQQLQQMDADVVEVFSRGQNPQHWHIGRRGLGVDIDGDNRDGEVYLEVERKEASLTDVDNVLAGVVRRFLE